MDSHAIYGYENWKHANLVSFHNWKLGVSLKNDLLYHEFSTIYFITWPDLQNLCELMEELINISEYLLHISEENYCINE